MNGPVRPALAFSRGRNEVWSYLQDIEPSAVPFASRYHHYHCWLGIKYYTPSFGAVYNKYQYRDSHYNYCCCGRTWDPRVRPYHISHDIPNHADI